MLHQNVRFTSKSGHLSGPQECPLSANSRRSYVTEEPVVMDYLGRHLDILLLP